VIHIHRQNVRFGDCDPAGIVYFPRFFHFFHEAMETWFDEHLGQSYADVVVGRRLGFPSVHTEADFRIPTRFGEVVQVRLRVEDIGRSSLRLGYEISRDMAGMQARPSTSQPIRVVGHSVVVVLDMNPASDGYMRSLPIPDDLRARMTEFQGR